MEGYKEFQAKLTKIVQPFIVSSIETDRQTFREVIRSTLENLDENRHLPAFTRRDEDFARRLFLEFDELVTSLLCMKDIEVYIRRFPYRDTGISSLRYLKYHIESYLNEIYLCQERVKAFLNFTQKQYRKSSISAKMNSTAQKVLTTIKTSLQNVIFVRGTHVHSRRFADEDFDRLTFLENRKHQKQKYFQVYMSWNINRLERNGLKLFRRIIWRLNNY